VLSHRVIHDATPWIIVLLYAVLLVGALWLFGEDGPQNSEPDPPPEPQNEPQPAAGPGNDVALAA
jgi:hypothetical protein